MLHKSHGLLILTHISFPIHCKACYMAFFHHINNISLNTRTYDMAAEHHNYRLAGLPGVFNIVCDRLERRVEKRVFLKRLYDGNIQIMNAVM